MKKLLLFTVFFLSCPLMQAASVAQAHSDLDAVAEEQIEGQPGAPSIGEQLAARAARLAAERLQKEKADKEREEQLKKEEAAVGAQASQPVGQPGEAELPAPANNGNVVEAQIEGANAEDRAVAFTSQMPDFLKPGQWDTFSGNEDEGLMTGTFEFFREKQHAASHSLILVRVFDGLRPYYYEANAFHAMLNDGGRLLNPQAPRTPLRVLARKNQINYFECKVGTRTLTYLYPYNTLVAAIQNGEDLDKNLSAHGYNLPKVSALEAEPAEAPVDFNGRIPREMRGVVLRQLAKWLIPITAGLIHGLINNYLARPSKDNWNCFSRGLPWRERVTGAIFVPLYHLMGKYLWPEYAWDPLQGNLFYMLTMLNAGAWQSVGETLPLPGYPGKRNSADFNVATLVSLYGSINQFRIIFA